MAIPTERSLVTLMIFSNHLVIRGCAGKSGFFVFVHGQNPIDAADALLSRPCVTGTRMRCSVPPKVPVGLLHGCDAEGQLLCVMGQVLMQGASRLIQLAWFERVGGGYSRHQDRYGWEMTSIAAFLLSEHGDACGSFTLHARQWLEREKSE
ncbi:hypothetical protein D3C84_927220 [compost metagenome]